MLDELDSNDDRFDVESNNEQLSDESSDENEVVLGEDDSDIETEFTDGIHYMLAEGESGSFGSDDVLGEAQ